ncbi:PilN domain-containing protein [Gracilimonas sediminicola]|uniref:PilN domain-containing protein n=1 Tax=Gracilimonas sediminicola TaxID=2952158 RepID=UPI0038D4C0D4
MKLPFLEHTVVALDVREDCIRWVELNRLGNRLSYGGHGQVNIGGLTGLQEAIPQIKDLVTAEAYQVCCSIDDILVDLDIEEMPYFEEPEEVQEWVRGRTQEYASQHEQPVTLASHVVEVGEDHRRCLFQLISQDKLDEYIKVLEEQEMHPVLVTTGVTEAGYAMIYQEEFVGWQAATLAGNKNARLCTYDGGLIYNAFEVSQPGELGKMEEADSYLRTEEVSLELPQHSIPLYTKVDAGTELTARMERPVEPITPLKSKLGSRELTPEYALACGIAIKAFFPTLDGINFAPDTTQEKGKQWEQKKETVRTGVLLFPPVFVILLLLFAIEGYLDVNLTESGQVLDQLSDKIELVNEKTEAVNAATASYRQVRQLVEKRRNAAQVFELVSSEIPSSVWLENMTIRHSSGNSYSLTLSGVATQEPLVADFMGALEQRQEIAIVELQSSRKAQLEEVLGESATGRQAVNQFQLRVEVSY